MRALAACSLLVACTKAPPSTPNTATQTQSPAPPVVVQQSGIAQPAGPKSDTYGTAHPTFVRAFDHVSSRWMALCQARKDTDGDGKIEIHVGHHGELFGDSMQLYFIIDGGDGSLIDHVVDTSADDRWVALIRGNGLELVDTQTRGMFELKNADIESDNRPGSWHRGARFATDRMIYVRHRENDDILVIHDLPSHAEREIVVKDRIWRFADADKLAEVYTIPRGQDFPRLETTLGQGECLGPPASWSSYGQSGPQPTQRFFDLDKGIEVKKPATPLAERNYPTAAREPDITDDKGPARWK